MRRLSLLTMMLVLALVASACAAPAAAPAAAPETPPPAGKKQPVKMRLLPQARRLSAVPMKK